MAKPFALSELEARVRALTRRGAGGGPTVVRHGPLDLRPGRAQRLHQRPDAGPVGARTGPARDPAGAHRPPGLEGTAGRPPVRMGRGSLEQRHRGLCAPPAQEDRGRRYPHRHRARPRLLPREVRRRPRRGPPASDVPRVLPQGCGFARALYVPPVPSPRKHPALAVRRDPRLDAGPAAAAVADEHRHHLSGGEVDRQPALRPRAGRQRHWCWRSRCARSDGKVATRLPGSARDILRADDVDSVYFQIARPARRAVDGDRDLPLPPEDAPARGRVQFRNESLHGTPVRIAYAYVACSRCAGAAPSRALALVQVAKRWKSAPSSPTRSSRA
jgi:hypothetical protein